jgi:hypothetical protein
MNTPMKSVVDFADSIKHRALVQELATVTNNPIVQEYCTRARAAVTLRGEMLVLNLKEFKDSASLIAFAQTELSGPLSWREIANKAARRKDVSAWVAAIKKAYVVFQPVTVVVLALALVGCTKARPDNQFHVVSADTCERPSIVGVLGNKEFALNMENPPMGVACAGFLRSEDVGKDFPATVDFDHGVVTITVAGEAHRYVIDHVREVSK